MKLITKKMNELTTTELYEILKVRSEIFVLEQNIHYQDMDNIDYDSLHCFFIKDNQVIAYLRAFYEDKTKKIVRIGRVLTKNHGEGLGKKLMTESIEVIKNKMNCQKIILDAQKHAISFYLKFGFKITSSEFLEEGIIHQVMELNL